MVGVPIVDAHVHLYDTGRFPYAWMKDVPKLNSPHLPADYRSAIGKAPVDQIVFVEVWVDTPHQMAEAEWVSSLFESMPELRGIVASVALEEGAWGGSRIGPARGDGSREGGAPADRVRAGCRFLPAAGLRRRREAARQVRPQLRHLREAFSAGQRRRAGAPLPRRSASCSITSASRRSGRGSSTPGATIFAPWPTCPTSAARSRASSPKRITTIGRASRCGRTWITPSRCSGSIA